jgi:hypothetical protein
MTTTPLKQYYLSSRPRHLRYIYFITKDYPYEDLVKLMSKNQLFWGGRFNPVIPVIDGEVSEQYKKLLQCYDPDFIFYTSDIDLAYLRDLATYNPKDYYLLDDPQTQNEITGIDGLYFLSQFSHYNNIISPIELHSVNSPLLSYFDLNFGIGRSRNNVDVDLTKNYHQIEVTPEHFNRLHEIIHTDKPISKLHLAEHNLINVLLRSNDNISYQDVEIVIAKDSGTTDDLLYFWNRKLYSAKTVLYITTEQLEILKSDKFFAAVLYDIAKDNFKVISMSLSQQQVLDIIEDIFKPMKLPVRFIFTAVGSFPFSIMDGAGAKFIGREEQTTNQLLAAESGLFHLPRLSFADHIVYSYQKWAIDIEIIRIEPYTKPMLRFPYTTNTGFFFRALHGRITKNRNIALYTNGNSVSIVEVRIPHTREIVQQLITTPVINGKTQETSIKAIRYNDASNRLAAFIKAFQNNFGAIDEFFTDIFWVETFEYLIKNNKQAGDAISFSLLKELCIEKLKEKGIELKDSQRSHENEKNLESGLKVTLEKLCSYQVFFKGFNLKCKNCSSTFWYHINDIAESVACKGCLQEFTVPVESNFYYKLNDLIKNNMFHTKDTRDGNLTVIRTLISLQKSTTDFNYLPQIDLLKNYRNARPYTDLDIICIVDGKLFIGEAKHTSRAFFDKNSQKLTCLDTLAAIAQEILPDTIVLSCYENPHEKLEKAQKGLEHILSKLPYKPKIKTILLTTPDSSHLGGYMYFQ